MSVQTSLPEEKRLPRASELYEVLQFPALRGLGKRFHAFDARALSTVFHLVSDGSAYPDPWGAPSSFSKMSNKRQCDNRRRKEHRLVE